jgi:dihydrofolate synthase/folylpolyglutamate synthase
MSSSEYAKALEYLFARTTGGIRFGLDRTLALLEALDNPHRKVPCIHVAGTNGKGSTVAALVALLTHKGLNVASYTSPHLIDFRERIVVGSVVIGEDDVIRFIHDHTREIEQLGATFFEATTAMAFDFIARAGADVSIIETGLGGRLDSTNVVDPLAAIVTAIGLDHTDLLGTTLEAIAAEKAGIFKPKRAAIIGERWPDIRDLLERAAKSSGAAPVRSVSREIGLSHVRIGNDGTSFSAETDGADIELTIGLIGSHQPHNVLTAWLALDAIGGRYAIPLASVDPAVRHLSLPGRFQRFGNIIFDVAHNPAGAAVVAASLASLDLPRPITVLLGVLSDKDWRAMVRTLASSVDEIIATTPPTAPPERRWHLEDVAKFAREAGIDLRTIGNFDEALHMATNSGGTSVVTGSFHTVGDAMSRLQVNPLAR